MRLLISLALSAATVQPAQAEIIPVVNAACSATMKKNALATINGQSRALGRQDFTTAIAYSTANFRMSTSVADFTQIISQSYSYLLAVKSVELTDCRKIGLAYYLEVKVVDRKSKSYSLTYLIQKQSKSELIAPNKTGYGIAAAQLTPEVIAS